MIFELGLTLKVQICNRRYSKTDIDIFQQNFDLIFLVNS